MKTTRTARRNRRPELILTPHSEDNMLCGRCEAPGMIIVPNVDPKTGRLRGVGLGQHAALCRELCAKRPWTCHKCAGAKVPQHMRWCEVGSPGYRAAWDKDRAGFTGQMLKLATMLAARGEMLPPFLMDILFDPERNAGVDLGMGSHL